MGKKEDKLITNALAALEKRYGEPVVMKMDSVNTGVKTFSSGRPKLDAALGGGYAVGKIIEIYSESGAGKTGLALEAAKSIQDLGGRVAIIDAEHALNTEYCELIGINISELYISQPSFGEQAMETIRALIGTEKFGLIIIDSVAAMVPRAELEGESGEAKIALQARMMSQGMKLITGAASDTKTTIMFINQLRSTIAMYGPSQNTTGGKALRFYATQRLEIKNKGIIKEGENVIGFKQHIKIVKNKVAAPFKTTDDNIIYNKGIDETLSLIESAIFEEVLIKKGASYSFRDTRLAVGMKKLRLMLEENPDILDEIEKDLKKLSK